MLNLIACTVGAGTITMPYVIALTGIAFGSILCVLGAFLSHYSSSLLVSYIQISSVFNPTVFSDEMKRLGKVYQNLRFTIFVLFQITCNRITGRRTYEDFAELSFGSKKWRTVASLFLMISLLGFCTAYISLCKTLIPSIIVASVSQERYNELPYWL